MNSSTQADGERRNYGRLEKRVAGIEEQLERGDSRMGALESSLASNTAATQQVLEIVTMGKAFFRVLWYIGRAAKWISGVAAAAGVLYTAWTHR